MQYKFIGWNGTKWLPVTNLNQEYDELNGQHFPAALSAMLVDGTYVEFDTERGVFPVRHFIGLTDRNGTEIFEGDILDFNGRRRESVEWGDESCGCCSTIIGYDTDLKYGTVIGNTFESPELLKVTA
jgi:YopX protein